MFCGLVGEPSYIAAAEPYYEVDTTLTVVLLIRIVPKYCLSSRFFVLKRISFCVTTHCSLVYKGPFGDWHEERLCNATDFLKDGQLEYQEYQVDVECRRPQVEQLTSRGCGWTTQGQGGSASSAPTATTWTPGPTFTTR